MVSIIIPIYNVEQYIIACLNSVAAQTYTDYEVILIDDCGTDRSMALVDDFLKTSTIADKVLVLRHNQNRGLSAARNTGTSEAKGEYIYYLDSDDTISPDCLEKLVDKAKCTDAEMVVGNINIITKGYKMQGLKIKKIKDKKQCIIGHDDIFHAYLNDAFYMMAWNKLIRRDFLEQHNIRFVEGLIHEDQAWSFTIACTLEKVAFVYDETYNYLVRDDSIQTDRNFNRHFDAYCFLLTYYANEAAKYEKKDDYNFRWWYEQRKSFHFGQTLHSGTKKQLHDIYAIIRENLAMKRWNKMQIHYQLPAWLGILAYKKWHGMWLV